MRTQYSVETVADRYMVEKQPEDYVKWGDLHDVSIGEDVYFSPLLPI